MSSVSSEGRGVWSLCKEAQVLPLSRQLKSGAVIPVSPHGDEERCHGLRIAPVPWSHPVVQGLGTSCLQVPRNQCFELCQGTQVLGLSLGPLGTDFLFLYVLSQGNNSSLYSDFPGD